MLDCSPNDKCNILQGIIFDCMCNTIPISYVTMTSRDKPWMTPYLKHLINLRWKAYRNRNFVLYNHYKNKVKNHIVIARKNWASRCSSANVKSMWSVVNSISGTSPNLSTLHKLIYTFSNVLDAVNCINSTLCNVFAPKAASVENLVPDDWRLCVSVADTYNLFSTINCHKTFGSDLVPSILYKAAASSIAAPFCHLFNICINSAVVPDSWKLGHVAPIPKCKNPSVGDIRPITLLPIPAKLLEKIVYKNLTSLILSKLRSLSIWL